MNHERIKSSYIYYKHKYERDMKMHSNIAEDNVFIISFSITGWAFLALSYSRATYMYAFLAFIYFCMTIMKYKVSKRENKRIKDRELRIMLAEHGKNIPEGSMAIFEVEEV